MTSLFGRRLSVINVGIEGFAAAVCDAGADVIHLEWRPPAGGDGPVARVNAMLLGDRRVDAANQRAMAAFLAVEPVVVGVRKASTVISGLGAHEHRLLHAGPPIAVAEMCGPMIGALIGAVLFEGWAETPETAEALLRTGAVNVDPCHHHQAVGPMAGVISPSMPVWVVEDSHSGRTTFSNLNEGLGKVLRFGAHGPEVLARLSWMRDELGPALHRAVRALGPGLPLTPIMAQALHMGDELHNRNGAATGQLLKQLAPALVRHTESSDAAARVVEFMAGNDHFFLNLSMAAAKLRLDAASNFEGSTLVTAMARNGVRFGIRLSGTGGTWFEAAARRVDGLYFPGYGPDDAAADLGDSAITETAGLGGFAMAAAPAITQFVGGTAAEAVSNTRRMEAICLTRNEAFSIPIIDFESPPVGIDARLVLDSGVLPVINTGIAHRQAGVGQIGAGITSAPELCFVAAIAGLAMRMGHDGTGPIIAAPGPVST